MIDSASEIVIVAHENPDGDAVGSALAWSRFLILLNKKVKIWLPGRFPAYYRWMVDSDSIRFFSENQADLISDLNKSDTLFAVDMSALNRAGKMFDNLAAFTGNKVLIDHHIDPSRKEFDHVFSDITVSSTCELIYHLIEMMELKDMITTGIAEALYVGIMTDTGSFSFNCNSPVTYEVVANLVNAGVLPDRVHKLVYDNNHENRIRLLGYALQKMKVLNEFHTAYITLDKDELEKAGSLPGDTEGIVNFALSVKRVVLAAFFSVRDGEVKISFRSKGRFSVNDFAKKHFNGGGHFNAAGGSFKGTMNEAIISFESILSSYKNELATCNDKLKY